MANGGEKSLSKSYSFHEGNMADTFFIRIAGDIHGPFDAVKVKQLAGAGRIRRHDELSRDRRRWTRARNVKGLSFPATSAVVLESTRVNGALPTNGIHRANGANDLASKSDANTTQTTRRPASADLFRPSADGIANGVSLPVGLQRSAASLPVNLAGCPDCGERVSVRAFDCPRCGCPIRRLPLPAQSKPRYRMLRLMASAYAALAITIVLVAASAGLMVIYFIAQGDVGGATAAFLALVLSITAGITCFAVSEALQVFLQIEQNTRATRVAVTHRMLSESGG